MSAVRSGTCVIPKSVFETAPAAAPSGSGEVKRVKRIDGTWEELPTLGADNPNFAARQAWPGGNIVTSNKDEALLKYYLRKKLPLPEHLQKLKDELGAAAMPSRDLRAQSSQKKKKGGGGRVVQLGGSEGGVDKPAPVALTAEEEARRQKRLARFGGGAAASEEAPSSSAARRAPRPKGGVKVLSGAEGAMPGEKRSRDEEEAA
jgi:hypothetical protein